jgi:hypothetical protein
MALGVNIVSSFDSQGIQKAIKEFSKLETTGERAQFAISKAALPAAAALAGLAAASGLAVKAAIEDQQEQVKLAQAIQQVTGASDAAVAANEEYLASLQRTTIFSDSEMRPALASLVQATGDLGTAQETLRLAMDISTATGTPLVAVTDALGKAFNGNMKALQSLSPTLRDNIKEGQNLEQVFSELNNTFGGATAAATNTAAGQMTLLRNQIGELVESFGMALLPIVQSITPLFASLANFAEENRTAFLVMAGAVAALSAAILVANTVIKLNATYQALMKIETVKNSTALQGAAVAARGFASALAGIAVGEIVVTVLNNITGAARNQKKAFEDTAIAVNNYKQGSGSATDAWLQFSGAVKNEVGRMRGPLEQFKEAASFKQFGKEFEIGAGGLFGNLTADIEDVDRVFQGFLDTNVETAAGIVDAMKAQLAQTDPSTRAYSDLAAMIARYEAMVIRARAATAAQTGALAAQNSQLANTRTLIQLVNEAQLRSTLGVYDDMRMRNANRETMTKFNGAVSSGAKEVVTAQQKLSAYTSALRGNYDAQRSLTSATNSRIAAEAAVGKAVDNTRRAQEYFNKVVKGFPKDSKEAIAATRDYANAQRRLRDAQISQRDAVDEVTQAEKKLRDLRAIKADPESVADAERGLEKAKYSVEEANFSVIDAETALAELRLNPEASPIEIRRAEIRLAEAKLGVTEAVNAVKDAEAALAREINRKATAEEIAEAEKDVMRAKMEVLDATEQVKDATIEEAAAQAFMNQVLNGATEGTDAYRDALTALNEAKDDEAEARLRVADAILKEAEAQIALREATEKLNEVRAQTPANIANRASAALAGISTDNPALGALNAINGGTAPTTVINNNINAGMGTDGATVAREIIDVLKSYERANGYVPIVTEYQVAV